MDALEAVWTAEHVEHLVGATAERAVVTCYPVPLRPGHTRRRTRWVFLLATDVDEREVRATLTSYSLEHVGRRGRRHLFVCWPREAAGPLKGFPEPFKPS